MVLRHERNHQLNRFLGLGCLIFSVVVPFIPLDNFFEATTYSNAVHSVIYSSYEGPGNITQTSLNNSISVVFVIYLIGVGVFSIRSFIGLATLIYYYTQPEKQHRWGFTVVTMENNISPFTFFNILFLKNQPLDDKNLDIMVLHEQFHRDQFHSVDTLIMELLTIIFWFNPAMWLFQRNIKAEHEYLADAHVLKKGINILEYQNLLFLSKTGISMQLVNYLKSKTSLTKRFKMMTNNQLNTKNSYVRLIAFLPAVTAIMFLSSFSEWQINQQPDVPAVYEEGMPAMYKTIANNIKYPKSARTENRSGVVYISFEVNENGDIENIVAKKKKGTLLEQVVVVGYTNTSEVAKEVNNVLKSEGILAVKTLGKFIPAQKDGKPVRSVLTLPIEFKISK